MSQKIYGLLFFGGLIVAVVVASFQTAPGYMDAAYYYSGGLRLAEGSGFSEVILWNFLDDPVGLPHPSHTYWMPLSSLVAYAGIFLAPFLANFEAAQLGFILIAAFIPPLTAQLSFTLSKNTKFAVMAGILAIFSGFYLAFITTTDAFGLYILLGGVFLLVAGKLKSLNHYLVLGLIAGLMHLSRADGILWLVLALIAAIPKKWRDLKFWVSSQQIGKLLMVIVGYLIIMSPWMIRNFALYGTYLSPGGEGALWFLSYDELFSYPVGQLTFARWWQSGLGEIISTRWDALGQNLQTTLAVQGLIVLFPLVVAGGWRLRDSRLVRLGGLGWLITFLVMTLVFPFSGGRGGFFHSGAALMTLVWALAPVGLQNFIDWGAKKRGWNLFNAWRVFSTGVVIIVIGISSLLVWQRVIGSDFENPRWGSNARIYADLESRLVELGARDDDIVLVNDPPSYYSASGRAAIVIPNGDEEILFAVVQRYKPGFVLLESNHSAGLADLYANPVDKKFMRYLETYQDTHIFIVSELVRESNP